MQDVIVVRRQQAHQVIGGGKLHVHLNFSVQVAQALTQQLYLAFQIQASQWPLVMVYQRPTDQSQYLGWWLGCHWQAASFSLTR
jgi:hypothetical protein